MSSCCPDKSLDCETPYDGYFWHSKGVVEQVGDLKVYRVGAGHKCIIWCYDIYGFEVGHQLTDSVIY